MKRSLIAPLILVLALPLRSALAGETGADDPQRKDAKIPAERLATGEEPYRNVWGMDVLISNDGFGLGTFYRRALTPDLAGVIALSISESKDAREVEQYDPIYGQPFTPGKLNRFLVIPLTFGLQYRLFREDIVETFRPYLNAGVGPAMVYQMPYVDLDYSLGFPNPTQVDFFKAIGRGHARYTATSFVGFGANVGGSEQSSVFGVNFRYYFTYLLSGKIPSLYNVNTGEIVSYKNSFGGFFITLNIGMGF
jgi:hypothetical protein